MSIPIVVPGASVLLKWVLPSEDEPYADNALQLRSAIVDSNVYALVPPLWIYEVGNTIARSFPDHAQAWLSALMKFALEEAPVSKPWLTKTLELVQLHDVTFYDVAYHALAIVNGGTFVTTDCRYATKTATSGSVVLVGDWRPPPEPATWAAPAAEPPPGANPVLRGRSTADRQCLAARLRLRDAAY